MKRLVFIGYTLMGLALAWSIGGCPSTTTNVKSEPSMPDASTTVAVTPDVAAAPPRVEPTKTAEQWFMEGVNAAQNNQLAVAQKSFEEALKLNANMHQAWYNIGIIYDRKGEPLNSERAYKSALRLKPNFYEAAINLSRVYLRQRRTNQAESLRDQKASQFPADTRFRNAAIYMRIHRGQLNQSEQMARALQRKNEKDSGAIMNLGLVWYKQKKYELARMAFNIARRSNRKEAAPNYYLGHVYMKLKNPTSAISSFQEAIKLRPNYPEALNALGVMYLKTSKVGLASAAFKRATEIMPKYWEAHINLGIALRQEQKINDALDRFLLVKKKNPYSNDAHYYLGILYLDHNLTKGRLQTARFLSSVPSSLQGDKAVFRQGNKIARYATASQYLQTYISRAAGLPADAPARKYLADAMKKKARAERGLKGMVKRKLKYRLRKLRRMRRRPPPAARKPAGAKAPANTGTAPANRKMIIVPVRRPAPR